MKIEEINESIEKIAKDRNISLNEPSMSEVSFVYVDIRKLAKAIGKNDELGHELINTKSYLHMLLGAMLLVPNNMSEIELYDYLDECKNPLFIDEIAFNAYLDNPGICYLESFYYSSNVGRARFGFDIITFKVMKSDIDDIDIDAILYFIEKKMGNTDYVIADAMNKCLCEIGVWLDDYTEKAIGVGKRVGPITKRTHSIGFSTYAPDYIYANRERQRF